MLSLLKQLCQGQSSLPRSVRSLYNQHMQQKTRPSLDDISTTLHTVSASFSRVFIVIDALDGCDVLDGCLAKLLSGVFDLQAREAANILATSRFIPDIADWFANSTKLEIYATKEDLEMYLEDHMANLPQFVLGHAALQRSIIATILDAADGMFLLADIYFRSLYDKPSIGAIRDALEDLRKRCSYVHEGQKARVLSDAYRKVMEAITGQENGLRDLAVQILSWITCATRPLSILELWHALAVRTGTEEFNEDYIPEIETIISSCVGLVTIDEKSGIIRLVHYTTQEYLENTQSHWFPGAHSMITGVCTTYLSYSKYAGGLPRRKDRLLQLDPLYDYAVHNWAYHARVSSSCEASLYFLRKQGQVKASREVVDDGSAVYENRPHFPGETTGLHLAALYGLREAAYILMNECDVNTTDCCGMTPLSWAAKAGTDDIALLLIQKGAKIDAKDNIWGRTPLLHAVNDGHVAVIRLLLKKGANIEARPDYTLEQPLCRMSTQISKQTVGMGFTGSTKIETNSV
ncbi:hypothetical protein GGR52DRAFT_179376 [Hypoxylon sp. FL1284]|nr:hypothetical protein GGR52DRAFT_179376 [Hypoxylon sp. FL1284]